MGLIPVDLLRDYLIYSQNNNRKVVYFNGFMFGKIRGHEFRDMTLP